MGKRLRNDRRRRVGKVSVYLHHGAWWLYYREDGRPVRKKVGALAEAGILAAQVHARLAQGAWSPLAFTPISITEELVHHGATPPGPTPRPACSSLSRCSTIANDDTRRWRYVAPAEFEAPKQP